MVVNNNPDLANSFSSLESLRRHNTSSVPYCGTPVQETDKVEIKSEPQVKEPEVEKQTEDVTKQPKKKSRGVIQSFKNCVAWFKKFGIGVAEYTVATAKGIGYGAVAAAGVLGIDAAVGVHKVLKAGKNAMENAPQVIENAPKKLKYLSTKGKILAGVAGLAVLGYHWFRASLNVSERSAAVDHRWGSGHDEVKD